MILFKEPISGQKHKVQAKKESQRSNLIKANESLFNANLKDYNRIVIRNFVA